MIVLRDFQREHRSSWDLQILLNRTALTSKLAERSQTSISTISLENGAHGNSSSSPKRLQRDSTRHGTPHSDPDGSSSDGDVIELRTTEASKSEEDRRSRGVHSEGPNHAEISVGSSVTKGHNCKICSKACGSRTELEDHHIAHSICLQQGLSVTPSKIQQGQKHPLYDRCGIPLGSANRQEFSEKFPTKSVPRVTGGNKKRNGETIESTGQAIGWPNFQDQRKASMPGISNSHIAPRMDGQILAADNTGRPILAPPIGYMNSNETIHQSQYENSLSM